MSGTANRSQVKEYALRQPRSSHHEAPWQNQPAHQFPNPLSTKRFYRCPATHSIRPLAPSPLLPPEHPASPWKRSPRRCALADSATLETEFQNSIFDSATLETEFQNSIFDSATLETEFQNTIFDSATLETEFQNANGGAQEPTMGADTPTPKTATRFIVKANLFSIAANPRLGYILPPRCQTC